VSINSVPIDTVPIETVSVYEVPIGPATPAAFSVPTPRPRGWSAFRA
jgi:hypothetical protein